ncbi:MULTISPECIES: HepT-like ribonuclease domain-containing protein [Methylorubrum]|jgi:uncharacterized protein with HEPN domain|uniref:DUF86 domain-containing protein n=2 Tax=Methylorubrum extorquens TaxID=408 RepID=C5B0Y9_METEA|nr:MULTISPECIES: HepT-like ribonuclease domain-containing protein [Methylorubrum]ACS39553.1 conserved hypothetical protein [Methylorubrum extorquens AM1]EHP91164.1 protein of unknown function DUF86 [Methylorubrum extorquens DSM 13060]BDL39224.1 DUF86 domain-containing protein [Methylorubrum sp. GM97]
MARRDYRHALDDMLAALDGIAQATAGQDFDAFCRNWLLKHGVERGIEIISEASRALPDSIKALRPEIPWHQVRAIGNILRHEYHGLSAQILWNVVVDELPRLRIAIEALQAQAGDLPSDPVDTI